jgi:hypothetical protein
MLMFAKRLSKALVSTIIKRSILLTLFIVLAPFISIFVLSLFMWDSNCTEDSRPVALARTLSQEKLAHLNSRIMELNEEYEYSTLDDYSEPKIPDDLKYLDARYISFMHGPYVVLAKCNVSVGVTLFFEPSRDGRDTIKLRWDTPTDKSPAGSEILWTSPA